MSSYHRHAEITDSNRGPLVNIAAWTLMVTSILFTTFRLISNIVIRGGIGKDDWIIIVATALAVGQTAATSMLVDNGLGQHQSELSPTMIDGYQKVAEIIALSFQCDLPRTHDIFNEKCIDLLAFWTFDAVFDIVTGLSILDLQIIIVLPLNMSTGRKFQAISAFAFQLPPCAFAIVRPIYQNRSLGAQDHTWNNVDTQIWTQINMHFNVMAANIPCLRMFLEGFQSVLFKNNLTTRLGPGSTFISGPRSLKRKQSRGAKQTDPESIHIHDAGSTSGITAAAAGPESSYETVNRSDENGSNQNGIYRTVEWTVLEDNNHARDPYK